MLCDRGLHVVGVDLDERMLDRARSRAPRAEFVRADVPRMDLHRAFDAAVSNAALHWLPDQAATLAAVRRHLVEGGTFVAEMGGRGNVATVDGAVVAAAEGLGLPRPYIRKFFKSVAEQASLVEGSGFEIAGMWSFPRPTPLGGGQTPLAGPGYSEPTSGGRSPRRCRLRSPGPSTRGGRTCAPARGGSWTTTDCVSWPRPPPFARQCDDSDNDLHRRSARA
jgi:SAM-dependent methyltransferase